MAATTLVDRAVLRVSGEDARGFLQGLVTNDLNRLAPDRPLWAGLLTPQGKALVDFILWAEGDDVLIDCEAAQADALVRRLALYRLRRRIEIAPAAGLAVHWAPDGEGLHDPRLAALGRPRAGSRTGFRSASPRARPSWGRTGRSGSNATRPSSMASASPRAAMSARRIRRG